MQVQGARDGCIYDNLFRQFSSLNIKILEINKIQGKKNFELPISTINFDKDSFILC